MAEDNIDSLKAQLLSIRTREWSSVLQYWFHGDLNENSRKKWFPPSNTDAQKNADLEVTKQFSQFLERALRGELDHWKWTCKGHLAWIIVLDQFSRHIYRHEKNRDDLVKVCDRLALEASEEILKNGWLEDYSVYERVFVLMPLRHQPTKSRMMRVLEEIENMEKVAQVSQSLITRFRRATTRRLHGIKVHGDPNDILEKEEFEGNEEDLLKCALVKTMIKFLKANGGHDISHVVVSLSGGIDSMVIVHILTRLKTIFKFEVVSIHIDYGNRDEARAEADFLEGWCGRQGVIFHKRAITEYKRGVTKRDDYEKLTRDIRFGTYRSVLDKYGSSSGVMFGHHKGDIQENVVSNMMKGCTLLNLSGMSEVSEMQGVKVWRPLLLHPKKDIYEYGHKYGVPYFKDTTPRWSTRGRMRNEVLPLLGDVYGDGFRQNLSNLAGESAEFHELIMGNLFRPFLEQVQTTPVCVIVPCEQYKDQSALFWKEVLSRVCEKILGVPRIRGSAIEELLFKLRHHNRKPAFLPMRCEYKSYMDGDGRLAFFQAGFFPLSGRGQSWNMTPYIEDGTQLDPSEKYTFGPWTVEFEEESLDALYANERVGLDDVYSGRMTYCLPEPAGGADGVYIIHAKAKAKMTKFLRGLPKRVKEAMPVVRLEGFANQDASHCFRVKLTFTQPQTKPATKI